MVDSISFPLSSYWWGSSSEQIPPQRPTATQITTYRLPGLSFKFALPYFVILIGIELVIYLCSYYRRWIKEKKKQNMKMVTSTSSSSSSSCSSHNTCRSSDDSDDSSYQEQYLEERNQLILYRWNDSFASLCCGMIQQAFGKVCTKYVELVCYCFTFHYLRICSLIPHQDERSGGSSNSSSIGLMSGWWWLAFMLQDHQYYLYHRFLHECNMGWATHAPHHSSEEYNLTSALRQGALQSFFSTMFSLPLAFIGISPELYAIQGEINLLYQYWIHTRVIGKFPKCIEAIFNTPSHHRVHHGRNIPYIDKNYGGTFIVFDKLYGTFEPESEEVVYGLVHPLQTFSPIRSQLHHWIDMFNQARELPTWKQKLSVFFRGPGYNPVDGTFYPIPETPPLKKLRKYDPQIPAHVTAFAFVHFLILFTQGLMFTSLPQRTYLHTLGQFVNIVFGVYNMSLLFDGHFAAFCWYERIRYVINVPIYLMNMFALTRAYVPYLNYHVLEYGFLQHQKISNMMTVLYLLSALYVATKVSYMKDIPRPSIQNWEMEREEEMAVMLSPSQKDTSKKLHLE